MERNNNMVKIVGKITEPFVFDHEVHGEKFYSTKISTERLSGVCDIIPMIAPEWFAKPYGGDVTRKTVAVEGQFRSFNKHSESGSKLILYIFVWKMVEADRSHENSISLDGYICKPPVFRETPHGREICDFLLAVNRPKWKTDYIPCICWGRNAVFASGLEVGAHIKITGRLQSREYAKRISETGTEIRTAYEVSIASMEVVNDEQKEVG